MKNIIKGNKLIAEFMGERLTERNGELAVYCIPDAAFPEYFRTTKFNRYHQDWNMLMSAVEKIESTQKDEYKSFRVELSRKHCAITGCSDIRQDGIFYQTPYRSTPESKIEAVWDGVVAFILWYTTGVHQHDEAIAAFLNK